MIVSKELRSVLATRYVTPFREGGSLPGLVEGDDDGLYVVKFRGAGQGLKSLVAEVIVGEIGRALALRVPDIVSIEIDPILGNAEPDPEIHDLLKASAGSNVGLDFLPGSLTYSPAGSSPVDPDMAAAIVWFDAYVMNVDRTARNPNVLTWHRDLWLIDHGAALYVHHMPDTMLAKTALPFGPISEHVLLPVAAPINQVADDLRARLTDDVIHRVVGLVPDDWFESDGRDPDIARTLYRSFLMARRDAHQVFEMEIERVRPRAV